MSERVGLNEPLEVARHYLDGARTTPAWQQMPMLGAILHSILRHLESQPQTPSESREGLPHQHRIPALADWTGKAEYDKPMSPSESSSSAAIVRLEATSDTYNTSYSWSSPVSQAGILPQSVQQAIKDSYSFRQLPGDPLAEVTLSIRTPKAATPPSGSASSSPVEEVSQANGPVGEWDTTGIEGIAQFLFKLLDDIDTLDDIARDSDREFRDKVRRVQKRRFEVATTDGFTVSWIPSQSSSNRTEEVSR